MSFNVCWSDLVRVAGLTRVSWTTGWFGTRLSSPSASSDSWPEATSVWRKSSNISSPENDERTHHDGVVKSRQSEMSLKWSNTFVIEWLCSNRILKIFNQVLTSSAREHPPLGRRITVRLTCLDLTKQVTKAKQLNPNKVNSRSAIGTVKVPLKLVLSARALWFRLLLLHYSYRFCFTEMFWKVLPSKCVQYFYWCIELSMSYIPR